MPGPKRWRVVHDADACVGHGRCYELAPDLFDEDDCGHGVVKMASLPAELEGLARRAADNCPEDAISLQPDE